MNFQEFKQDIEKNLDEKVSYELLEFNYSPYSFGSGLLVYRLKGCYHRFIYDGREDELILERGKQHDKYLGRPGQKIYSQQGLDTTMVIPVLTSQADT